MTAVVKCFLYWNRYADQRMPPCAATQNTSKKGRCPVVEEKNGKKLGRKAKQEQSAGNNNAGKPKKRVGLRILGVIGTLMLVGVLTAAMFVGIFMYYVETALKGHVEVDLSEYTQEVSTELYYKDPATGEWFMYQTLFANENRIWVDSEEIPD